MRETAYTMAVTRVRANENGLLTAADIDRLVGAADAPEVMRFLSDKGYGGAGGEADESMFSRERERAWGFIREIAPDFGLFFPMVCRNDFHNVKALVKGVITGAPYQTLLMSPTVVPLNELRECVADRRFEALPVWLRGAAEAAYDAMAHSGDGQLADILLDRAYLDAVAGYGADTKDMFVRGYCETIVETADIRMAVRGAKTGKSAALLESALAPCPGIDTRELLTASREGVDAVADWLVKTSRAEAADALRQSAAALEKWCDDRATEYVRRARYEIFGVSPLYQFITDKEAEIAAVRIIYTGKRAGFAEEKIRNYLRALA